MDMMQGHECSWWETERRKSEGSEAGRACSSECEDVRISDATDESDSSFMEKLAAKRLASKYSTPLPKGVKDIAWVAPSNAGLEHSNAICSTQMGTDGRMTLLSVNDSQAHYREWQQDNGIAAALGTQPVEKIVDGKRMTVHVSRTPSPFSRSGSGQATPTTQAQPQGLDALGPSFITSSLRAVTETRRLSEDSMDAQPFATSAANSSKLAAVCSDAKPVSVTVGALTTKEVTKENQNESPSTRDWPSDATTVAPRGDVHGAPTCGNEKQCTLPNRPGGSCDRSRVRRPAPGRVVAVHQVNGTLVNSACTICKKRQRCRSKHTFFYTVVV